MTLIQGLILAAVQGFSELFPISSLAHAVILPRLLGWPIDQNSPAFLPFLVMLHVGTACALLLYFWREWIGILYALVGRGANATEHRRMLLLLVVGTIPAVLLGFLLERFFRDLFGSPLVAATFLVINGVVLLVAERLRRTGSNDRLSKLTLGKALLIGLFQAGALIPGFSRSGLTIAAGLGVGLNHSEAARFSFLLAAPIIAGAAVLELPKLIHASSPSAMGPTLLAGVVAGVTAYASTAFLLRFFKRHDFDALNPFAYYCLAAGGMACFLLTLAI